MSDLSRLLEDVYRSGPTAPAAPAAPSWSSDSALDDAFADWVPGPSDDAHAAERAFAGTDIEPAEPADEPDEPDQLDQLDSLMQQAASIAAAMVEDELEETPAVESAPEPVAVAVPTGTWCRQDDDILPSRGHGRRGRISLKRR